MSTPKPIWAERIRIIRQHRRLSQTDLARKIGVGRLTVHRIEAGTKNLHVDELLNIAEVLDVNPTVLITNDPFVLTIKVGP